ncbi:MAG: hypothetical protein LC768_07670, partial [Acidobacteria bacterium]|nr:hypothetical protein [Acidobacteriota bacterium]MCA1638199.1 hypothetical protein [Acidobacteriota bacterium]
MKFYLNDEDPWRELNETIPHLKNVDWGKPSKTSAPSFFDAATKEIIAGPSIVIVHPSRENHVLGAMAEFAEQHNIHVVVISQESHFGCEQPFGLNLYLRQGGVGASDSTFKSCLAAFVNHFNETGKANFELLEPPKWAPNLTHLYLSLLTLSKADSEKSNRFNNAWKKMSEEWKVNLWKNAWREYAEERNGNREIWVEAGLPAISNESSLNINLNLEGLNREKALPVLRSVLP